MAEAWEIRKGSMVWVSSPIRNCGYSSEVLRSLQRAGFRLYHNGKPAVIPQDVKESCKGRIIPIRR